ncbi:hypothetical protein KAR91_23830 [Candidatus Pacearchaeota archaeon]|nr:hypothetical protein [Candidatus Pacearchaeota archaeon]
MTERNIFKPSFSAGEITPTMDGRVDLEQYNDGAELLQNMIVHPYGGVSNRPGSNYVADAYSATEIHVTRLVPFTFSVTQAYMLEFSHNRVRVFKDGALVTGGTSSFATTYSYDEIWDLDFAQSADVLYVAHRAHAPAKISRTSHTAWSIADVTFLDGPWRSQIAGDEDITITPSKRDGSDAVLTSSAALFSSDMVGKLFRLGYPDPLVKNYTIWGHGVVTQYTSDTVMKVDIIEPFGAEYVVDPGLDTGEEWHFITGAISSGRWVRSVTSGDVSTVEQKIFLDTSRPLIWNTLVESLNGAVTDIVAKIGTTPGGSEIYSYTWTGVDASLVLWDHYVSGVDSDVDNVTSSYSGLAFLTFEFTVTSGSGDNRLYTSSIVQKELKAYEFRRPAWTSTQGYPSEVCFHEQRLTWGGALEEPQTFWPSQSGDFEDQSFHTPLQDNDAFSMTLAAKQVNDIRWMLSLGTILAGTGAAIWGVSSGSDAAMSPTAKAAKIVAGIGSSKLKPIIIGDVIIVCERGGSHVRAVRPSGSINRPAQHSEISIKASHLLAGFTITDWAYARDPDSIIWAVRSDGVLLGLTYLPEYDVLAWHRHVFTDNHASNGTTVESVSVIEGLDADKDDVYLVTKRYIDSAWVRYIELLQVRILDEDTYDYHFLECGLSYNGSAITTVTGLDHLEGQVVTAIADGLVVTGKTVSSGEIELDIAAAVIRVGLPYVSDIKMLRPNLADRSGSSQGRERSVVSAVLRLFKTRRCFVGPDEDRLEELQLRTTADLGLPTSLFTGDFEQIIDDNYDLDGKIMIRNTDPAPFTLLAVTLNLDLADE